MFFGIKAAPPARNPHVVTYIKYKKRSRALHLVTKFVLFIQNCMHLKNNRHKNVRYFCGFYYLRMV